MKDGPCGRTCTCEGQPACLPAGDPSGRAEPVRGARWMARVYRLRAQKSRCRLAISSSTSGKGPMTTMSF